MDTAVKEEISRRVASGARCVTMAGMRAEFAALGYTFRAGMECDSVARYLSGPHAGASYPARTLYVVEKDTGRSAFHVDSRRDAAFHDMQRLRGLVFAVSRDRIIEA